MKKILIVAGCMAMTLAMTTLSFAIQLTPEGAGTLISSMNGNYVTSVKEGQISYTPDNTAFSPTELDTILKGYGLSVQEDMAGNLPVTYATIKDGKVDLVRSSTDFTPATAFTPVEYHAIFTSYGLQLDSACIQATMDRIPYATKVASDGTVTLSDRPTAFTGQEYADILYCYNLATKKMAAEQKTSWVIASDYLFDFDKSVIKKQYYGQLDEIAAEIKSDPTRKVEIQGHTDSVGSEKYNMGLSERRANAVRNYLIKRGGVNPDQLTVVGYGETMPIAPNTTKEGRAKNRRVELKPMM
jgi:OOP family OmpA-OmpF porin